MWMSIGMISLAIAFGVFIRLMFMEDKGYGGI